jgi:copper type II ascorbate-dependent monooxygenase-like protein
LCLCVFVVNTLALLVYCLTVRVARISILFALLFGTSELYAHTVTFNNQVVRIFQQHCQTCHRPGNIAPFSLLTYDEARGRAFQIRNAVMSGEMPPWKPVNAHGVFEGERSLSDEEVEMLSEWAMAGAPEGAPEDLPEAITFPQTWQSGEPNIVSQPSEPYAIPAGADDIYRCFPIAVNSTSDLYVRGYELLPGNRKIVHHIILFLDEKGESVNLDNADPGPGYTCFGGVGFNSGAGALGAWAPGVSPQMFPLGTGVRIAKDARIVMQVHYSTHEAAQGPLDPDLTRVGIYLSPTPLQAIQFLPVVNPFFSIPAGNPHYQVKAFWPITADVDLISIAPHMHLLGREMTVEARFPNGTRRELIKIDDWDFHWQALYNYKEPVRLPAGTMIELTAYYDNSSNNPKNPSNPPIPVGWGERTVDEMCLAIITVKAPGTPSLNTIPFTSSDRGTTSVLTQGGADSTRVGSARVTATTGGAPSGLAIFGYRPNGILLSEAGVPASRLLSRGRLAAQRTGDVRSGLAIANPNNERAAVSFFFTDANGQNGSSGTISIPANGQISGFLDGEPFNGPSSFSGSLTFSSSIPVAAVALRGLINERSDLLWTTLPVVELGSAASTAPAVFPDFADGGGWTSEITLVNPTDNPISGALQFADQFGQPMAVAINSETRTAFSYAIPPRTTRQFRSSGGSAIARVGTVWIVPGENSAAPGGSLVFTYAISNIRITEAGVTTAPAGNAFRVYVEAADTTKSGIAITNTSNSSATVRLELIDLNGASIAGTKLTLAAKAQASSFLNEIPGFQTLSGPFRGLLRLSSPSAIAVVGLRSRTNERGDFLVTTTPPVQETTSPSASELFFPHFADSGGYTTQFILFGTGAAPSLSGNVRFFSQLGQPLDVKVR